MYPGVFLFMICSVLIFSTVIIVQLDRHTACSSNVNFLVFVTFLTVFIFVYSFMYFECFWSCLVCRGRVICRLTSSYLQTLIFHRRRIPFLWMYPLPHPVGASLSVRFIRYSHLMPVVLWCLMTEMFVSFDVSPVVSCFTHRLRCSWKPSLRFT